MIDFESNAEKQVAEFLDQINIKWEHQPKLVVKDDYNKERLVYPDFLLPEFGIYLEVCGANRKKYYENKKKMYDKNSIPTIFVHTFRDESKWKLWLIFQTLEIQNKRQSKMLSSLADNFIND